VIHEGRVDLDSVQIGAADVEAVTTAYRLLFDEEPTPAGRFELARGAVEIVPGTPGLLSVRFRGHSSTRDFHGLPVVMSAEPPAPVAESAVAIDHIVVRTVNAPRAIALWRDAMGLRLALDRIFAERGLRLLFFRTAGVTLEFAAAEPPSVDGEAPDVLYGVSYRVPDVEAWRARLEAAGIDVSPVRPGMRPGTSVVTVRSGTGGVPTLLLQVHG